jgi:lipoprotein-releasing system ATP-binding protein
MANRLLEVKKLGKHFVTGGGTLEVLRDVDFSVSDGEIIAVIGESGTGKSTLLHLLGALDKPTAGSIRFQETDLNTMDDEALASFRNKSIGFVFQFHHLLPEFSAIENVSMPALIQNQSLGQVRNRALELLSLMGLDTRASHRPSQLSGGERQRVAVARALMNNPSLILADEPSGNLDTRTAEALHDEFFRLNEVLGQTFIIATHNLGLASRAARVLRLAGGRCMEEDPARLDGSTATRPA